MLSNARTAQRASGAVAAAALLVLAGCGTSSQAAAQTCRIGQMKITLGPLVSEKTEQHTAPIILMNVSGKPCALRGYPRFELFDQYAGRLRFSYAHGGDQMITAAHPGTVHVAGHAAVYFAFNSSIEANAANAFCRTTSPCRKAVNAVVSACAASQLAVNLIHTGAGLGTVGGYIAFKNTSRMPCSLTGWPTLVAVTASGQTTTAIRQWSTMFGPNLEAKRVPTVILHHDERADAVFTAGDHGAGPTGACPPPYRYLRVTPPNGTRSIRLSAWITGLGAYLPRCTGIYMSVIVPSADLNHG